MPATLPIQTYPNKAPALYGLPENSVCIIDQAATAEIDQAATAEIDQAATAHLVGSLGSPVLSGNIVIDDPKLKQNIATGKVSNSGDITATTIFTLGTITTLSVAKAKNKIRVILVTNVSGLLSTSDATAGKTVTIWVERLGIIKDSIVINTGGFFSIPQTFDFIESNIPLGVNTYTVKVQASAILQGNSFSQYQIPQGGMVSASNLNVSGSTEISEVTDTHAANNGPDTHDGQIDTVATAKIATPATAKIATPATTTKQINSADSHSTKSDSIISG